MKEFLERAAALSIAISNLSERVTLCDHGPKFIENGIYTRIHPCGNGGAQSDVLTL